MVDATVTPRKRPNDACSREGATPAAATATATAAASSSGASSTTPAGTASPASPARKKKPSFSKRTKLATAVARSQVGRVRVLVVEMATEMRVTHSGAYLAMLRYYASMAATYQPDGDDTILDIFLERLPPDTRLNSLTAEEAAAAEEARPLMGPLGGEYDGTVPTTAAGDELIEYLQCPVYQAVTWRRSTRALKLLGRPNDPADPPLRHAEFEGERRLLHDACRLGLSPVVKALVAWPHAVPVLGNTVHGLSPLDRAVKYDRPGVVRALCKYLRAVHGEPWWVDVIDNLRGAPGAPGERRWAAAYLCLFWDSLEALQALLAELPDGGKGFLASSSPKIIDGLIRSPVEVAVGHASLQCLKWLVEEHDALRPPVPPLLHDLASGIGLKEEEEEEEEEDCLVVARYLVEECGVDTGVLVKGKTAAEVAVHFERMRLHEYLTRGKRAAAADEAAEALLAELEAEEERKARKQQQKKKKKDKNKTTTTTTATTTTTTTTTTEAEAAATAALEQTTGKLAATALSAFDEDGEDEEVNPGATAAASGIGEDCKMPAPTAVGAGVGAFPTPPKKKRERKKKPKSPMTTTFWTASIPESEGRGRQGKGNGKAAAVAMQPPTAAGDCSAAAMAFPSSPVPSSAKAKVKVKAVAAQDPREFAFLLKYARREDKCPLSGALLTDPVIASDGITYDRAALHAFAAAEAAADRPLLSPVTGQPIAGVFFPNQNVKRLVESAVEELRAEWRRPGRR